MHKVRQITSWDQREIRCSYDDRANKGLGDLCPGVMPLAANFWRISLKPGVVATLGMAGTIGGLTG